MIGIISDTHDNVVNIKKAMAVFLENNVEFVIHCGDIIAPATVQFFKGVSMKFIFGNCDGDKELLQKKIAEINGECLGDVGEVKVHRKVIGIYHGTDPQRLEGMINSKKYDYIFTGHTHESRDERVGNTRIINPGAHYYDADETIALLDIQKDELRIRTLK